MQRQMPSMGRPSAFQRLAEMDTQIASAVFVHDNSDISHMNMITQNWLCMMKTIQLKRQLMPA